MNIINLDQAVINALNLFSKEKILKLGYKNKNFFFVVGSGNAFYTGKLLFSKDTAIFANENNYKKIAKNYTPLIKKGIIKEAIIISASGEKDSVWQVKLSKKLGLKTTLFTCSENSSADKLADRSFYFKKTDEPYTYNVSTYLGMILSQTGENPKKILEFVKKLKFPKDFSRHQAFSFALPDKYAPIAPMLEIKARELFGSKLNLKAYGINEANHAKYVIPCQKELVITIDEENKNFGHEKHRWNIQVGKEGKEALILCLTYYIIGKIQEVKPAYFKKNIENYCKNIEPKIFNKNKATDIIVKGNI
ncbi:hypothetical protein EOL94_01545 [bacterium]|nr:hypothetical protein [bacterium]